MGWGCSAIQVPDPAPARVVVAGEAEVHAGSVGSASRFTHPGGSRRAAWGGWRAGRDGEAGGRWGEKCGRETGDGRETGWTMTDWNYGDVWETVADVQPESVAVTQGRAKPDVGRLRQRGRRGGAVPARPRRGTPGQGRGVPLQLPRVHPGHVRRHEDRARAGQHELSLRRRRARVSLGQRRRGGGRVPRRVHRAHRAHPRPCAGREGLALGRRRQRALPRLGHPLRGRRQVRRRPGACAVGTQRRRPLHALHRRHDGDAQGRHVAPGRPLRPAHRRRCAPLRRQRRRGRGARRPRGEPGRCDADAGLPAHARDRRLHRQHDPRRGGSGVPARVAAGTTPWRCSTPSRAKG